MINDYIKTTSGHFFGIYINIFPKTEVQMVIFRCLIGLNFIWFKSYEKYGKMQKTLHRLDFCYKTAKIDKMEIFVFCHLSFANYGKHPLKYGFHKKYFRKNEPLTSWTLFSPVFFQISTDQHWSGKKRGEKVFNWSEVHFFGSTSYEIHILTQSPVQKLNISMEFKKF